MEIWEIEPSSRKVRVFLWRDATGVELARVGAARGVRGDERTLLADVGERALAHARVAEALGPAFIRGKARAVEVSDLESSTVRRVRLLGF